MLVDIDMTIDNLSHRSTFAKQLPNACLSSCQGHTVQVWLALYSGRCSPQGKEAVAGNLLMGQGPIGPAHWDSCPLASW